MCIRDSCVLVQIPDPYVFGPFHPALIGHELAGNNVLEGGFAFPVDSNKANVLAL